MLAGDLVSSYLDQCHAADGRTINTLIGSPFLGNITKIDCTETARTFKVTLVPFKTKLLEEVAQDYVAT